MPLSSRFVKDVSKVFQDVDFSDARSGELALEVERLNTAVRAAAASSLDFDAEPSAFFAVLAGRTS
jgi:hypothetical protein